MENMTVGSIIAFGSYLQYNGHFSAPAPIEQAIPETNGQTARGYMDSNKQKGWLSPVYKFDTQDCFSVWLFMPFACL